MEAARIVQAALIEVTSLVRLIQEHDESFDFIFEICCMKSI
jgi:hypothetical protein